MLFFLFTHIVYVWSDPRNQLIIIIIYLISPSPHISLSLSAPLFHCWSHCHRPPPFICTTTITTTCHSSNATQSKILSRKLFAYLFIFVIVIWGSDCRLCQSLSPLLLSSSLFVSYCLLHRSFFMHYIINMVNFQCKLWRMPIPQVLISFKFLNTLFCKQFYSKSFKITEKKLTMDMFW